MTTYRNEDLIGGDTTRWLYDIASGSMTNKVYADGKGPTYSYSPDGKLSRRTWVRGISFRGSDPIGVTCKGGGSAKTP